MQRWHIHLLQPKAMPIVFQSLANGLSGPYSDIG
jgi:hypothetical protein